VLKALRGEDNIAELCRNHGDRAFTEHWLLSMQAITRTWVMHLGLDLFHSTRSTRLEVARMPPTSSCSGSGRPPGIEASRH
jgi:hypothetical protein